MRPAMHCNSVLLPEPDSPTMATTSPANSSNDAALSAQRPAGAVAKRCDRLRTRSSGSVTSGTHALALFAAPITVGTRPQPFAAGHQHFIQKAVTAAAQCACVPLAWHGERMVVEV